MDVERIKDKLDELTRYLKDLEEDLPGEASDYLSDRIARRACEKDFELACETLIDICNLVISEKELGKPVDNRGSIDKLVRNSVLSRSLGEKLKNMIGFRNLLVHRYGKVDDSQAFQHLKNETEDFYKFIKEIDRFLP